MGNQAVANIDKPKELTWSERRKLVHGYARITDMIILDVILEIILKYFAYNFDNKIWEYYKIEPTFLNNPSRHLIKVVPYIKYDEYFSINEIINFYDSKMQNDYKITLKFINNNTNSIETVDMKASGRILVWELQCKIFKISYDKFEIDSPKSIRIIFAGKQLEWNREFSSYSITKLCTLHVIIKKPNISISSS